MSGGARSGGVLRVSLVRFGWGVLVASCLVLLGLIVQRNATRGRFARPLSTYGSGPQGARALYLTLGELGFRTARWSQDLARLPARASLIALGSCESAAIRELSRYEREELVSWVERGGLLLVAGARNYIPEALGVAFEDDRECALLASLGLPAPAAAGPSAAPEPAPAQPGGVAPDDSEAAPDELIAALSQLAASDEAAHDASDVNASELLAVPLGSALKGLALVPFRAPPRLITTPGLDYESLLTAPQQGPDARPRLVPLALTYRHGQGRVIVLSSANMLQNAELLQSEGATLLARLLRAYAPRDLLIFDEYHLGVGERRSLTQYLRQTGLLPLLGQLLLVAAVMLWRAGARMGAIRSPGPAAQPPPKLGFVRALGRLYARVGDRNAATRLIARGALHRIAQHYALESLPASALERELSRRGAARAAEAVRAIARIGSSAADEPLVVKVARIDAARETALQGAPGGSRAHTRGGKVGFFFRRR